MMNESNEDTKDSVQVCSFLHVAHVRVRRVILVIVHYGSMVLKVYLSLNTLLRSHLFVNCCIRKYSIYMFSRTFVVKNIPNSLKKH